MQPPVLMAQAWLDKIESNFQSFGQGMNMADIQGAKQWALWVKQWIIENFILFALAVAIIFAFSEPAVGIKSSDVRTAEMKNVIAFMNTVIVFFVSGITLKVEALKKIMEKSSGLVMYGLFTINIATTAAALLMRVLPFPTKEYAIGLSIFSTVPTTLGVGVALTQTAQGDHMLSLFLTIVSNLLGVVTIPFLLSFYLSGFSDAEVKSDPATLAIYLAQTVLAPTCFGMLTRWAIPAVPALTATYKQELSMFSLTNLMMIVWMSLSNSRDVLFQQSPAELLLVLLTVILQHLAYLAVNYLIVGKALQGRINRKQATSLIIMCSQKSSPVAISVITVVAANAQQRGLLTVPCILGQLSQILVGAFLCRRLARWVQEDQEDGSPERVPTDEEQPGADVQEGDTHAERGEGTACVVDDPGEGDVELTALPCAH